MDANELHDLALKTRRIFEDYVAIRPDDFDTTPELLECCCGIASWFLCRQLWRVAGIESLLVFGEFHSGAGGLFWGGEHCWVETCGHVIDITATQYSCYYRPVEIVRLDIAKSVGYEGELIGEDAYDLINTWEPGPSGVGARLARYADRRVKTRTDRRPRPLRYGAPKRKKDNDHERRADLLHPVRTPNLVEGP